MGEGQFIVQPGALCALAGKFDAEAGTLAQLTNGFTGSAFQIGQAFGLLGACDGALEKYLKLLESTVKALGQLSKVLEGDGERLRANATVYTAADQGLAEHFGSLGR